MSPQRSLPHTINRDNRWKIATWGFVGILLVYVVYFAAISTASTEFTAAEAQTTSSPAMLAQATPKAASPTQKPGASPVVYEPGETITRPAPTREPTSTPRLTQTATKTRTPSATPTAFCPGAPPQRLRVDEDAIICTKRDQVILRIGASKSYREIDRFPPGTILSVIEGPVCADSWSWWKVRVKGLEGWMSEGGDQIDAYFLCPN